MQLSYERATTILVEALFFGDVQTAKRWNVHRRTIENYRTRLADDPEFVRLFQYKKELFERNWADDIPLAIRSAVRFLQTAAQKADPTNPESIHAVAGALKILAEVGLTKEIIDVRLGRHNRENGAPDSEMESIPAAIEEMA